VARQAFDEDAAEQPEAVGAVDVDMIETVGGRDEPLAVGAEAQLVGIDDVLESSATSSLVTVEAISTSLPSGVMTR